MEAADSEDQHVGAHRVQGVDRRRPDERVRSLVERAAEHRHLDARVLRQRDRDRRAVRDHRRLQIGRKVARNLERRRARIEQDHLAVTQQAGGRARDRGLRGRRLLAPHGVRPRPDRGRQRASVHPPHAPGLGKLLQVAPDRVE